jgi:methyl-accepting chemotaxis protein
VARDSISKAVAWFGLTGVVIFVSRERLGCGRRMPIDHCWDSIWRKKMKKWTRGLRLRLLGLPVFPVIAVVALFVLGLLSLQAVQKQSDLLAKRYIPQKLHTSDIKYRVPDVIGLMNRAVLFKADAATREKAIALAREQMQKAREAQTELKSTDQSPEFKALAEEFYKTLDDFENQVTGLFDLVEAGTDAAQEKAVKLLQSKELNDIRNQIIDAIVKLNGMVDQDMKLAAATSDEIGKKSIQLMIFLTALTLVLSFVIVVWTASRLAKRLTNIQVLISSGADSVRSAGHGLSQSSSQLSDGASSAAAAIEECVASSDQMLESVRHTSKSSKIAAGVAVESNLAAEQGSVQILQLIENIKKLSISSEKIQGITAVIDEISFQTNLLALNAAVEAARAGDHGRGFSVVAEAVRNLASRSSTNAKEINILLRESSELVGSGMKLADGSGDALKKIVEYSHKVSGIVTEISSLSSEQSTGLEQINQALQSIDRTVQMNASSSGQVAEAAGQLQGQSDVLASQAGSFYSLLEGQTPQHGVALDADDHPRSQNPIQIGAGLPLKAVSKKRIA